MRGEGGGRAPPSLGFPLPHPSSPPPPPPAPPILPPPPAPPLTTRLPRPLCQEVIDQLPAPDVAPAHLRGHHPDLRRPLDDPRIERHLWEVPVRFPDDPRLIRRAHRLPDAAQPRADLRQVPVIQLQQPGRLGHKVTGVP